MIPKNGYFQVDIRSDGTYVNIYAPENGGKKVDVQELANYLEARLVKIQSLPELNSFVQSVTEGNRSMKVSDSACFECDESVIFKFAQDRMMVVARFYPPSTNGRKMDADDIIKDIKQNKVKCGILEERIRAFATNKTYCTDVLVAKGIPVTQGKDAIITYNFDANPTHKPKLLEDGSVDFHELNIFTRVQKGDLLATLTPAEQGKPGMDVFGNAIPPAKVKNLMLKHGRNIVVSEDKLSMYSEVSGDVKLEGDTVFVSDTYHVAADVDTSTGDINYDGNVVVSGNVRTGFTIRAKGSVQVNGVVEGANIYSGDSIVLKRGMQGMSRGRLEAEGDIVANFVESGTLIAKKNITVGSLLHCKVDAGNDVVVSGKKAFIIGGEVSARHMIEVSVAGNHMGTTTVLRVGVAADTLDSIKQLTEENEKIKEQMEKYNQVLEVFKAQMAKGFKFSPEQIKTVQTVGTNQKQLDAKYEANCNKIEEITESIRESHNSEVRISNIVNAGTEICINENMLTVKDNIRRCKFKLDHGRIESVGY